MNYPILAQLYLWALFVPCAAADWCGVCDNAPSRSWSWWFGFGECECYNGWSGRCCSEWSVSDWSAKVDDWTRGESCEGQPDQACKHVSGSPAKRTFTQQWSHEPTPVNDQSECAARGCMWVECFASDTDGTLGTASAADMCSHCAGAWEGACEWHHYSPSWLAFAGPGEHCGFRYPACPESAATHCFCGDEAVQELRAGWCSNGMGMDTFCPSATSHGDGRSQPCSWNGWTVSPQHGGDIEETCRQWGF